MRRSVDGYFAVDRIWVNPKPEVTVSGYTPQEIEQMYWERTEEQEIPYRYLGLVGYDAIWTAALALNKTVTDLNDKGNRTELYLHSGRNLRHMRIFTMNIT